MTMHDIHTGPDRILYDGCPRCAEHAEHPHLSLDDNNLRDMWDQMVEAERNVGYYRNNAEKEASRHLYYIALFVERMLGIDPWQDLVSLSESLRRDDDHR